MNIRYDQIKGSTSQDSQDNNDANAGTDQSAGTQDAGSRIALLIGQQNIIPQSVKNRHMGEPNSYILSGLAANRPTTGITVTGSVTGRSFYYATDYGVFYSWNGLSWDTFQRLLSGVAASRPTSGSFAGEQYFATDTFVLSIWTGLAWKSTTLA